MLYIYIYIYMLYIYIYIFILYIYIYIFILYIYTYIYMLYIYIYTYLYYTYIYTYLYYTYIYTYLYYTYIHTYICCTYIHIFILYIYIYYKEIPGLTVSALRKLDAAHCEPGVMTLSCHGESGQTKSWSGESCTGGSNSFLCWISSCLVVSFFAPVSAALRTLKFPLPLQDFIRGPLRTRRVD